MGNLDSKRLAQRAWLKQKGARYGGVAFAALLLSASLASSAQASKWPPALSHPALDAASALVLRASPAYGADEPCGALGSALPCAAQASACATEAGAASATLAGAQRKQAFHGDDGLALRWPNGLLDVDDSPLLEVTNNGVASSVLARVGALGREASHLADGGCDLGGGRSGLDSVLSSLIVLALAAMGMRFRT